MFIILAVMRKYMLVIIALALVVTLAGFTVNYKEEYEVPYPEGYRKWTHIKTGVIGPKNMNFKANGGFHHIYSNEKGMIGYETGTFPEGSILVFDVIEGLDVNSNLVEGKRKYVAVMVKDSVKFKDRGGWGFEQFNGDSKTERTLNASGKDQCYSCHVQKETLVWSKWRN
jgi:hypothetical protein